MVVKDKDDKLVAPTASEIQFLQAMARRGIAFKFARLMTYEQHNTWVSFLMQSMQREAPPGYNRPSLHQCLVTRQHSLDWGLACDQYAKLQTNPFRWGPYILLELRVDPTIALYLAPLARAQSSQVSTQRTGPYSSAPKPASAGTFEKKGKGKGKTGKTPPMPVEERNKWHRTANGDPLCFGYNTSNRCDLARDGERCSKGWHLCADPGCLQPHGLQSHPKKALDKQQETGQGM